MKGLHKIKPRKPNLRVEDSDKIKPEKNQSWIGGLVNIKSRTTSLGYMGQLPIQLVKKCSQASS